MSFSYKILCRNIKNARKAAHLTQQTAAEKIGISLLHYGRLERCDRSASIAQIDRIAEAFHVPCAS